MHYDFIEIGTSDFDSLVESCKDDAVGLCVEPVKAHLDKLPSKPNVKKICAAISLHNIRGNCNVFFVPSDVIADHGLPEWLKGCNSIGKRHPQHHALDIEHLVKFETVQEMPIFDLLSQNDVTSIGTLKIDTEGGDCQILMWFFVSIVNNPRLSPSRIIFEKNSLTNEDDFTAVLRLYNAIGYTETGRYGDNVELEFVA
jgi:hypothetical protein